MGDFPTWETQRGRFSHGLAGQAGAHHGHFLLQLIQLLLFLFLLAAPIFRSGGCRRVLTAGLQEEERTWGVREAGASIPTEGLGTQALGVEASGFKVSGHPRGGEGVQGGRDPRLSVCKVLAESWGSVFEL